MGGVTCFPGNAMHILLPLAEEKARALERRHPWVQVSAES